MVLYHYATSVIGLKNSRHCVNQSEVNPEAIVTRRTRFPELRASYSFYFDWFVRLSLSFMIGQRDYFGFGYTMRN